MTQKIDFNLSSSAYLILYNSDSKLKIPCVWYLSECLWSCQAKISVTEINLLGETRVSTINPPVAPIQPSDLHCLQKGYFEIVYKRRKTCASLYFSLSNLLNLNT